MTPKPPEPTEVAAEEFMKNLTESIRLSVQYSKKKTRASLVPGWLRKTSEEPEKPQVTSNHRRVRKARKLQRQNKRRNRG